MILRPADVMPHLGGERNWCKAIRSLDDLNLRGRGGWALCGAWIEPARHIALDRGELLVIARTDRRGNYHHTLLQAGEGERYRVLYRTGEIDETSIPDWATDAQLAERLNWPLYRLALECARRILAEIGLAKRLVRRAIAEAVRALRTMRGDWVPDWSERLRMVEDRRGGAYRSDAGSVGCGSVAPPGIDVKSEASLANLGAHGEISASCGEPT